MNKKFYGFTLIEAIVSICILTILSTIGFVSYSSYTRDSRDANRVTAVANIQESIEQIKMKNAKVPNPENITGNGVINGVELFKIGIVGDLLSQELHLNNTPQDPLNKNNYSYGVTKNNKEYQIATILENKSTLGIIQKTYADFDNAISKVNGNYDGLIAYNSGGSCLVNVPSLIVSTGGTFDVSTTDPGYVIDKGENIPFLQNSKKIVKENKQNIVLKKTNSQTGGIAGICNINFATQSGSLRYVFGESGKKIGENLGILVKEEPKIDKPLVCENDLTQTNIDNLNNYFSGSTYSGSTKDYWCGLTDLYLSGFYNNKINYNYDRGSFEELITNQIPDEIGMLTNLKSLTFINTKTVGKLPDSLGSLKNLEYLELRNLKLSNVNIPNSIGNLTKLNSLILDKIGDYAIFGDTGWGSYTSSMPSSIGNLVNLKKISITNIPIGTEIPESIGKLVNVEDLNLENTRANINLDYIKNFSKLKTINLKYDFIIGGIPESIGNLTNLEEINFFYTRTSGVLPNSIWNLTKLKNLTLNENNFTGSFLQSNIKNLVNLEELYLYNCKIGGNIPSEIGNLIKLKKLNLGNNNLIGIIPDTIGNLINLNDLSLNNNYLSGNPPSTIGNLIELKKLIILDTGVSDKLPIDWKNLKKLESIWLDGWGMFQTNFPPYSKKCKTGNPSIGVNSCIEVTSTGITITSTP